MVPKQSQFCLQVPNFTIITGCQGKVPNSKTRITSTANKTSLLVWEGISKRNFKKRPVHSIRQVLQGHLLLRITTTLAENKKRLKLNPKVRAMGSVTIKGQIWSPVKMMKSPKDNSVPPFLLLVATITIYL